MTRVPADLALYALHQSGYDIKPATLRQWVRRGHITRGPGGYDLDEILAYLTARDRDQPRVNCSQVRACVTLSPSGAISTGR